MINCQDVKHLFDRYLDGELSPSLHTELNAHRLNCTSCQSELAMLETCGDVIAMDHREPELSASFTDRVLMAQRTRVRPRPRRWVRRILVIGSPMAAAASIGLVLMLSSSAPKKTVIGGIKVAVPQEAQKFMLDQTPSHVMTDAEKKELNNTPQMSTDGFLDALLAPLMEKSRNTLEGTRRGAEELVNVFHQGWSDTNDKLMAEYNTSQNAPQDAVPNDAQPADSFPYPDSGTDSTNDSEHVLQPL